MVTVDKLRIHGFGRFHNKEIELSPGLNVVFGGNEAGKSTFHSFIEAMLFGFWKPNLSHQEKEQGWDKYRPWQAKNYGGEMDYSWSGGQVTVIRDFANNAVLLRDTATGEELGSLPLNSWSEPDFARLHFGCSKLVFRNTISISQLGSATDTAVAMEVRGLLSNLAQSGGSGISVKKGLDILVQSRTQTEFERVKTCALLEQVQTRLAEAQAATAEAARLEIQQYRAAKDLDRLTKERRRLKEIASRVQGQAAVGKLERLGQLRRRSEDLQQELAQLTHIGIDPSTYQDWQRLQAETEKIKELNKLHIGALEEASGGTARLEQQIAELAAYSQFNKDTLIEMSSAWQIQAKGQQVIEEMQQQLDLLAVEIREVTTELTTLPYFRPDTLEQAATLQATAGSEELQGSQEELEQDLESQQKAVGFAKAIRGILILLLPAIAFTAWLLNPFIGAGALPVLLGIFGLNGSINRRNLRCRNLRRQVYTVELEFQSNLRQREQAQRELGTVFERAGVDGIKDLEKKYRAFAGLSDRNRDLLREQKFIGVKIDNYRREAEAKTQELQQILAQVGLDQMPVEQALACFRVNLDKLLDLRTVLDQSKQQEGSARLRLEQSRQELTVHEERIEQMMQALSVNSPAAVEMLAEKYTRRQELEQELVNLETRIQDQLQGVTEQQLRQQAAAVSSNEEIMDVENLSDKEEELEQQILETQTRKSEGIGRLDGIYTSLPSPAELKEELGQLEQRYAELQVRLEAHELAESTIAGLAEDLNSQLAPELNQMVSSLVDRITGGKYQELQVARDMSISVSTPDHGEQVELDRLSGGTIDQFYFACRVAIADLVTGGGLPLFLDDSFVQYDDQRLRHMLRLLAELGNSRQVILLTCQQREVEQLTQLAPGRYNLINLEN